MTSAVSASIAFAVVAFMEGDKRWGWRMVLAAVMFFVLDVLL